MGMFDRMEKGIERAVNGAFAKAFRSEVEPVEIASALRREVDARATVVSRGTTLVPNTFVVELGPADRGRLEEWGGTLSDELRTAVMDHARQQQYAFVGSVTVVFEEAEDLETGLIRVRSSITEAASPASRARPQPAPPQAARPAPAQPATPQPSPQAEAPRASRSASQHISLDVAGRAYHVTSAVTVLGRGAEADVVVEDVGVSRRHAEIRAEAGKVWVNDLRSTNGTFVDERRVNSAAELADGSRVRIGTTEIVVHFGSW